MQALPSSVAIRALLRARAPAGGDLVAREEHSGDQEVDGRPVLRDRSRYVRPEDHGGERRGVFGAQGDHDYDQLSGSSGNP